MVGPNDECEFVVVSLHRSAVTDERSDQDSTEPDEPGNPDSDEGPTGDTGASSTTTMPGLLRLGPEYAVNLVSFTTHRNSPHNSWAKSQWTSERATAKAGLAQGNRRYEAWARGWWREGLNIRLTETVVEFRYNQSASDLSFEGSPDYECDEFDVTWEKEECGDGLLPSTSSSIGRFAHGQFRTKEPIASLHPLLRSHSLKTDLIARSRNIGSIHVRCVSSHEVPDGGIWPITTTFECDGTLERLN